MALYAIAGDGTGNKTEVLKSLSDLRDKAEQDDAEFWFVIQTKEAPNPTDKAIMDWMRDKEIWFECIGEENETYAGAQIYHDVKNVNQKIIGMLNKAREDGEEATLLALFVDPDQDVEDDGTLLTLVEKVSDEGFPILLLNGQLAEVSVAAAESEETVEETAADEEGQPVVFTREELQKMQTPELAALAKGQGIDTKGLGKRDLITALLGEVTEADEAAPSKQPAKKAAAPAKTAAKKAAAKPTIEEAEEEIEEIIEEIAATNGMALVVVHYQGRVLTAQVPAAQAMAMVVQ